MKNTSNLKKIPQDKCACRMPKKKKLRALYYDR